jgi:hypothetical protein
MDAESVAVRPSMAPLSLFEGCGEEEGWERAVQCHGVTPTIPHSTRTTPGWLHSDGLFEQCRDLIPRPCQEIGVAGIHL